MIPGKARLGLDIRQSTRNVPVSRPRDRRLSHGDAAARRGMTAEYVQRSDTSATPMDAAVVEALTAAAAASGGVPPDAVRRGPRHGAGAHVPSAMLFVPCKDGVSHDLSEEASSGRRGRSGGRGQALNAIWRSADRGSSRS